MYLLRDFRKLHRIERNWNELRFIFKLRLIRKEKLDYVINLAKNMKIIFNSLGLLYARSKLPSLPKWIDREDGIVWSRSHPFSRVFRWAHRCWEGWFPPTGHCWVFCKLAERQVWAHTRVWSSSLEYLGSATNITDHESFICANTDHKILNKIQWTKTIKQSNTSAKVHQLVLCACQKDNDARTSIVKANLNIYSWLFKYSTIIGDLSCLIPEK